MSTRPNLPRFHLATKTTSYKIKWVVRFCGIYSNVMRMAQESGAGDEDYIQKAMIHYQAECGLPFKFRHCWEVLKDSPKFQEKTFPNFNQGSQGSSKRQKSSGSSSFNAESGDVFINFARLSF
ncbi:putative reverse transcriptase domain-containing protein [Tanacetum coccineum]